MDFHTNMFGLICMVIRRIVIHRDRGVTVDWPRRMGASRVGYGSLPRRGWSRALRTSDV